MHFRVSFFQKSYLMGKMRDVGFVIRKCLQALRFQEQ